MEDPTARSEKSASSSVGSVKVGPYTSLALGAALALLALDGPSFGLLALTFTTAGAYALATSRPHPAGRALRGKVVGHEESQSSTGSSGTRTVTAEVIEYREPRQSRGSPTP